MTRSPMPSRDRGGSATISNPDDGTPIREMFSLGDRLLLITDKCTYAVQLADQIDPDRTNPAIPWSVQQKLFDHGVESELLCQVLLQAKVLFRKEFQTIDIAKAMQLAFDGLSDMIAMDDAAKAFRAAQELAITKAESLKSSPSSLSLPAIGNVRALCKGYMQKADHAAVSLLSIVRIFLPELKGKPWSDLLKLAKDKYGEDDTFFKVAGAVVPFLQLIRNARDCLDHANVKGAVVRDFGLQADGQIAPPRLRLIFEGLNKSGALLVCLWTRR